MPRARHSSREKDARFSSTIALRKRHSDENGERNLLFREARNFHTQRRRLITCRHRRSRDVSSRASPTSDRYSLVSLARICYPGSLFASRYTYHPQPLRMHVSRVCIILINSEIQWNDNENGPRDG